jgi:hypothetical protein
MQFQFAQETPPEVEYIPVVWRATRDEYDVLQDAADYLELPRPPRAGGGRIGVIRRALDFYFANAEEMKGFKRYRNNKK